jgi:hypothetical protein
VIGHWIATSILVSALLGGGVAELMHGPDNAAGMIRLGYPLYFMTILGLWKLVLAWWALRPQGRILGSIFRSGMR